MLKQDASTNMVTTTISPTIPVSRINSATIDSRRRIATSLIQISHWKVLKYGLIQTHYLKMEPLLLVHLFGVIMANILLIKSKLGALTGRLSR